MNRGDIVPGGGGPLVELPNRDEDKLDRPPAEEEVSRLAPPFCDDVAPPAAVRAGLAPPARQSLTVQSTPEVKNKSLKSTDPSAGWKSSPVTGPECPRYTSLWINPAFAPARSYRCAA